MIRSFADETTADIAAGRNTKAARRIASKLWPRVQEKLKILDAAPSIEDLAKLPGNRYERLKRQPGRAAIRVNDQYRVTFRWEHGDAYEVKVEDYHDYG
ncbi:MAG: plasmid maintenance system killer protein [Luteitalea sp.]|nr:plasmid maintenance system killer protein [Luteitalea sp.]